MNHLGPFLLTGLLLDLLVKSAPARVVNVSSAGHMNATMDLSDLGFERGLLMLSCGKSVIRIAPPLSMSKSEMDEGLKLFEEALTAAEKEVK